MDKEDDNDDKLNDEVENDKKIKRAIWRKKKFLIIDLIRIHTKKKVQKNYFKKSFDN